MSLRVKLFTLLCLLFVASSGFSQYSDAYLKCRCGQANYAPATMTQCCGYGVIPPGHSQSECCEFNYGGICSWDCFNTSNYSCPAGFYNAVEANDDRYQQVISGKSKSDSCCERPTCLMVYGDGLSYFCSSSGYDAYNYNPDNYFDSSKQGFGCCYCITGLKPDASGKCPAGRGLKVGATGCCVCGDGRFTPLQIQGPGSAYQCCAPISGGYECDGNTY
ncbi:MAG: hypothetical protein FWF35_00005 [Elusimicrobia bacterium]|nr:hypothetical protein [Elusimicrobiota bacterium]